MYYSPFRYPGGKGKLAPFVSLLIEKSGIKDCTYIEPFAGGAGVALYLLLEQKVSDIVVNDFDKAIYSAWKAILEETDRFTELINCIPITLDEWKRQKEIYLNKNKKYSFELGFATFYLNRTNRSGILNAGPIGGYDQKGNYLIDARFNREALIDKIRNIKEHRPHIHLYNKDIVSFITSYLPKYQDKAFVYFDPPYYNKGEELYRNFFTANDHLNLAKQISNLKCCWMVTYDDVDEICKIYSQFDCKRFDLTYSLANSGKKSEIMFLSDNSLWPTKKEMNNQGININLRKR